MDDSRELTVTIFIFNLFLLSITQLSYLFLRIWNCIKPLVYHDPISPRLFCSPADPWTFDPLDYLAGIIPAQIFMLQPLTCRAILLHAFNSTSVCFDLNHVVVMQEHAGRTIQKYGSKSSKSLIFNNKSHKV